VFGSLFKGSGGAILAVGIVAVVLAIVAAAVAFTDEQDNRGQEGGFLGFGGPDEERSEMNFGLMEGAVVVGGLGVVALVVGIVLLAFGGGVDRVEEHRRRVKEARVGAGPGAGARQGAVVGQASGIGPSTGARQDDNTP